jgi:hypothetical protein
LAQLDCGMLVPKFLIPNGSFDGNLRWRKRRKRERMTNSNLAG